MHDAQKQVKKITLNIPIQNIQPSLIDELNYMCETHKGDIELQIRVFDTIKQNVIIMTAPSIHIDKTFYHWIKMQEMEEIFTHIVQ